MAGRCHRCHPAAMHLSRPRQSTIHLTLTLVWVVLVLPTLLWWRDLVLWVSLMSLWANIASHWAAFESARAKEQVESSQETATPAG